MLTADHSHHTLLDPQEYLEALAIGFKACIALVLVSFPNGQPQI